MLMAALAELLSDPEAFVGELNALGLPGVRVFREKAEKCGIGGTRIRVTVDGAEEDEEMHGAEHGHGHGHHHSHTGIKEIRGLINGLSVSDRVKRDALAVYNMIAEAEGYVHGCEPDMIHFHEVGTMDAVCDIVGVCMLMERINPETVYASPVHVGCGSVKCAHGVLPVPAPAAAYILKGVPVYGGSIKGELCTPTGAALLKYFVGKFGDMPVMSVSKIGYGMGKKDFEQANCVRAMLDESADGHDEISELRCNIDDMTPEALAFAQERLFEAGALDVYTTAAGMKKNRCGIILSCMCRREQRDEMLRLIFKHTSTIGVREYVCRRYVLKRSSGSVDTEYGTVRVKRSEGWGVSRCKPEYEDMAEIARKNNIALSDIKLEK